MGIESSKLRHFEYRAEGELVGCGEAFQDGQSVSSLVEIFEEVKVREFGGDNRAALHQLTTDCGSWRTRHLRLRASRMREIIMLPEAGWKVIHVPGKELMADGLTKALLGQSRRHFVGLMNLYDPEEDERFLASTGTRTRSTERPALAKFQQSLDSKAAALVGAGTALVCGSEHKKLGAVLVATGMVVNWWEGRKKHQEPAGQKKPMSNQEPVGQQKPKGNQEPQSQQKPKSNQEPQSQQEPLGQVGRKNQEPWSHQEPVGHVGRRTQDPKRTQKAGFETGSRLENQGNPESPSGSSGRAPGLRAFRIPGSRSSRNGASSSDEAAYETKGKGKQSAARQRGRDAYPLLQQSGAVYVLAMAMGMLELQRRRNLREVCRAELHPNKTTSRWRRRT